jgi:hypothetical protein
MDERLDTSYKIEQTLEKLFIYFTVLTIIISFLDIKVYGHVTQFGTVKKESLCIMFYQS